LRDVLGEEQRQQMAAQSGLLLNPASELAKHLPGLIDRLTSDSTVSRPENSGTAIVET
jgi:uncharacterized protein YidB (DUF937 family)